MATMIAAADVKKLRDQTGAGMMDCKAALAEAGGDFEQATTILRKKGLASAAKKAGRATSEGLIGSRLSQDYSAGILVQVNCESDFVARTADFQQLIADVLTEIERVGDAADQSWLDNPNGPVKKLVAATIGKLGENMTVPRFVRYAGQGYVGQYIHPPGRIGVLVEITGVTPDAARRDELKTLVNELALQIAAASPTYVSRAVVPSDVVEREKSIYRAQVEGKPANVIEKIVEGKLGSFYEQVVLVDQLSIRPEPKQTVGRLIEGVSKTLGIPLAVSRFARLNVKEQS